MSNTPIPVLLTVNFSEELLQLVRQVSPRLQLTTNPARNPEDIPAETWREVEILYTDRLLPPPASAPNLRWVQFHYAGIDHVANHPLLQQRGIDFTTLSGAAAPQVAEYAVAMMLALGHKLPDLNVNQAKTDWPRDRWERFKPVELRGSTVGLVGYGSIGREIARILYPMGVRVLAAKRDAMHPHDNGYIPEGLGDNEGDVFTRLYPTQAVKAMFKECDFVIICVPLTPVTRGMIGEAELAAMKPGAFLIDVSRGGIVNPGPLLGALQDKRLAGAALDVFAEEPLPPNSPFWKLPNVIVSPHISGISAQYPQRAIALFVENLKRYLAGTPLYNLYNPDIGY
jgi:phosphoglycerate dehydrogenase-like enzyme